MKKKEKEKNSRSRARELGLTLMGGLPHEPWHSSKSDGRTKFYKGLTQKAAPHFDTTATSHGGDKEPCPGLQISEWDSN